MTSKKSSGNVFADLGFDDVESSSLKTRSDLMIKIEKEIAKRNWTQARAADEMGVSQPRISDLVRGKIDLFSTDSLIDMLSKIGVHVAISVESDVKDSVSSKDSESANPFSFFGTTALIVSSKVPEYPENEQGWNIEVVTRLDSRGLTFPALSAAADFSRVIAYLSSDWLTTDTNTAKSAVTFLHNASSFGKKDLIKTLKKSTKSSKNSSSEVQNGRSVSIYV